MTRMNHIAENLAAIDEQIAAACKRAGRSRGEVRLMAVSKTHPAEAMCEALGAGLTLFGENRVQEFQRKSADLVAAGVHLAQGGESGEDTCSVHLIGHLQSNKAAKAVELFSAVDTVDSLRLAERLDETAGKLCRTLPVLLEIKLSDEEAKTGLVPSSAELASLLDRLPGLDSLKLRGLMTVAPFSDDPSVARSCFRQLRQLRDKLAAGHPRLDFSELSMGMSGDFEAAIEEGSTVVRIGTALFGARPRPV